MFPSSRFVLALLSLACAAAFLLGTAQAQSTVAEVIITHVEAKAEETGEVLVSAIVSVLDEAGQPVVGLTTADFALSENNLPIDEQLLTLSAAADPLNITLLIETSSRMAQPDPSTGVRALDTVKDAATAFVESLKDGDQVAVYDFDSQARRQQEFTYDHNLAIDQGINKLDVGQAETACLPDALLQIMDTSTSTPPGPHLIIALTGSPVDESCPGATVDDVLEAATTAGNSTAVFVLGFGDELDREELQRLGDGSGGRTLLTPNSPGLTELLTTITAQLNNQYKLSYPTQASPGLARMIIFEKSSEQSDRRQVLIPVPIEPTPTPLPQFAIDLTIEPPVGTTMVVKVDIPPDVDLASTELYLNNKLIEKIVAAPFDQFEVNINELGSGKHNVRVEAVAKNGVTASKEAELTLRIPPTPAPTIPPTAQPVVTPEATPAADAGLNISRLALVLIIAGLVLLLILMGLVGYLLFFYTKRPLVQHVPPAPPPTPVSPMITVDDETGGYVAQTRVDPDETMIDIVEPIKKVSSAPRQAGLAVLAGQQALAQSRFDLDKAEVKIGRNHKEVVNDIAIEDREVSRAHARIIHRNGQYFIQDLGSATGTSVNGVRLNASQEMMLKNGAEIAIGPKVKFQFFSAPVALGNVTLDDSGEDEFRTVEDGGDDPHETLFDYDPRK
ncbi:MAG: FHA domain-containing protein [Anaerolineales bacterium]|nr:FHA domain-containing protein [Anaerolineales bacterium]